MTCGTSPGSNRFETYVFDAAGNTLETLPDHRTLEWSDSNGMLLLLYATPEGAPNEQESLVAYNVDDLMVVAEFPGATTGSLSSDGRSVASYRPPGAACVDDCEPGLFITSLEDATESQFGDYVPLAWVSGDASLIVRSGQPAADGSGFEAFILNVETGALDPVPALNGFTQVWPAPGGNSVVYLSRLDGLGLAILDVPSLQSTEITGSKISYPSDHIPEHHVALTEDEIYWFDATGQGAPWYRANYDGTGLIELGAADSYFLRFSVSASYVSYIKPGSPEEGQPLVVATIDGDEVGDLGPSGSASAWRLLAE
jgi:hypothetical protein